MTPHSSPDNAEAGALVNSAYDELSVRFSGVHSDDVVDSILQRLHVALIKLGIDPTAPYIAPDTGAPAQCMLPGLVSTLRSHADDCENEERWAVPELAPLLRRAADVIEAGVFPVTRPNGGDAA